MKKLFLGYHLEYTELYRWFLHILTHNFKTWTWTKKQWPAAKCRGEVFCFVGKDSVISVWFVASWYIGQTELTCMYWWGEGGGGQAGVCGGLINAFCSPL